MTGVRQKVREIFSDLDTFFTPRFLEEESSELYYARLTLIVSVLLLVVYSIPELIFHIVVPQDSLSSMEFFLAVAGSVVILGSALLAKWGWGRLAAWVLLIGWTVETVLEVAFNEGLASATELEIWLMFGLVIALAILFDLREYILFVLFQTLFSWGVVWIVDQSGLDLRINFELHFAAAFMLGLVVLARQRYMRAREEASAEILRQKAYLQKVIDAVQSPFYVVDVKDYRIRLANRAARELGLFEDRVTCYALTHRRTEPCSGDEHPCPLQHVVIKREPYATEHIHFRPDGTPYYAEVRGYPLFDENGEVVQMVEYSVDITERKRAEAEIRKLQQAVEYAASGVAITDPQGVFEYVNPAFERITGYSRDEVIGKTPRLLKSGKHPPEFYANLWQTILRGEVWQGEIINRRKDGSLYWEFQTIAPVLDSNGKIQHFVSIRLDITRQKEMEQQLLEAKEKAEAASAFKSRLLANVSHDMRTPLGAILGYAEMLREGEFGPVQSEQMDVLNRIIQSAQRLDHLIRGMLLRAQIESGKIEQNKTAFDPQNLLQALGAHRFLAERKGLRFEMVLDPDFPSTLYGDPYWFEQILVNLVENAIKYTQQGSVTVRLRVVDDDHWAIEVQDTGVGIPPEKQSEIFESFTRLENTNGDGLGLGLSIVKDLVEHLGGELQLQSTPGVGSTFTIIFPIGEAIHATSGTDR